MTPPWRYRLLVRLLSPLLIAYTLWRGLKDGGLRYVCQRLGWYLPRFNQVNDTHHEHSVGHKRLWIHAASVGEVFTVLPLLKAIQAQANDASILVTTGTPTGALVLEQHALTGVRHQFLPIDFPGACRRFLEQAAIDEVYIVETEIWPWLYACCAQKSIDITLVNGRLSEKTSSQATGILASSYRRALKEVRVLARSEKDMINFIKLGASPDKVQVAGNLKYTDAPKLEPLPTLLTRPYVLAASTHADEEWQLAQSWSTQENVPLLVIVPRHPERGPAIHKQLVHLGSPIAQRSLNQSPSDNDRIYLADTLGELQAWYQSATATFVGGSLIERGGHNMLEPARYACPTIVGPHTHNFDDIMEMMLGCEAIAIGKDADAIADFLVVAASGDLVHSAMGERARTLADDSQNVLQRYESLLLESRLPAKQ